MRKVYAPAAFDWLEVIVVREGTGMLTHRDDSDQELVRPGHVVVLLPNVPCGLAPEGRIVVSRLFYRPAFVIEQIRWADPLNLPDHWAAASRFERALPSQVVTVGRSGGSGLDRLADKIAQGTAHHEPGVGRLSLASWAIRVLGVIEDHLACAGAHGLFVSDADVVERPTEPCFGVIRPLRPEIREAMRLIRRRFDHQVSLAELTRTVHLSRAQLERLFTEQAGKTPKAYQDLLRVKHMVRLLLTTDITVAAVSAAAGWSNPSRAARVFREATTMSPSEYRRAFAGPSGELLADTDGLTVEPVRLTLGA
jgi:AraC-like DNA-binding protein